MKDDLIYDHFQKKWIDPSSLEQKNYMDTIKGIFAGVLVSLLLSGMVLLIALGLWGK